MEFVAPRDHEVVERIGEASVAGCLGTAECTEPGCEGVGWVTQQRCVHRSEQQIRDSLCRRRVVVERERGRVSRNELRHTDVQRTVSEFRPARPEAIGEIDVAHALNSPVRAIVCQPGAATQSPASAGSVFG